MKKALCLYVCFAIAFQLGLTAFAYTYAYEDLYTLEIPDGYTEFSSGEFVAADDSSFSASFEDNSELKYCVDNLSEEKLREAAEYMASEASAAFSSFGKEGKMEVISVEKKKHSSGMDAVVTVVKTTAVTNGAEETYLQKVYEFGGAVNKYTFVFTPTDSADIDSMDSTFDSIRINEVEAPGYLETAFRYVALAVILVLLCLGILKFFKKPKRK